MTLDTQTLFTSVTIADFAGAAVLLIFVAAIRHTTRDITLACLLWSAAMMTIAAGTVLIGQRGVISDTLSIVVANAVVLLGAGLRPNAVAVFFKRRTFFWLPAGLALTWFGLYLIPAFRDTVAYRVAFVNGAYLATTSYIAWTCFRHNAEKLVTARILGLSMVVEMAGYGLIIAYHVDRQYTDYLQAFQTDVMTIYLVTVLTTMVIATMTMAAMAIERIQARFEDQARQDSLTGLPNRRAFHDRAAAWLSNRRNAERNFAVILLDADQLKQVNDSYGQRMGDVLLQLLGRILDEAVTEPGFTGRIEGGKFALFLPETELEQASLLAQRIARRFTVENREASGNALEVTLSGGIFTGTGAVPLRHALETADRGLSAAKTQGRNQIIAMAVSKTGEARPASAPAAFARRKRKAA